MAILALLAVNAHAYDFESDGIRYNVLSEEDRTVAISGDRITYRGNIVIPDRVLNDGRIYTVTAIGNEAFSGCDALTSVDLSSTSITYIDMNAFSYCDALTSVDLSSTSLTFIAPNAFYDCDALTSVDLSSTPLTSIYYDTFYGCDVLTSVKFPVSLTSIDSGAFYFCI